MSGGILAFDITSGRSFDFVVKFPDFLFEFFFLFRRQIVLMRQKFGIFRLKIGQKLSLEHFKRHGIGMAADGLKQPFSFFSSTQPGKSRINRQFGLGLQNCHFQQLAAKFFLVFGTVFLTGLQIDMLKKVGNIGHFGVERRAVRFTGECVETGQHGVHFRQIFVNYRFKRRRQMGQAELSVKFALFALHTFSGGQFSRFRVMNRYDFGFEILNAGQVFRCNFFFALGKILDLFLRKGVKFGKSFAGCARFAAVRFQNTVYPGQFFRT